MSAQSNVTADAVVCRVCVCGAVIVPDDVASGSCAHAVQLVEALGPVSYRWNQVPPLFTPARSISPLALTAAVTETREPSYWLQPDQLVKALAEVSYWW